MTSNDMQEIHTNNLERKSLFAQTADETNEGYRYWSGRELS